MSNLRTHDVQQSVKQSLLHRVVVDLKESGPQLHVSAAQPAQEGWLQFGCQLCLAQRLIPVKLACTDLHTSIHVNAHAAHTHTPWQAPHILHRNLHMLLSMCSLVDVEHYLQELNQEVHIVREPLLVVDHHPRQEQGQFPQRGDGVERYLVPRPHPLIHNPGERLEHLHILCVHVLNER